MFFKVLKNKPPDWQLKKSKNNPDYPFAKYIMCPICGYPLKTSGSTNGRTKKTYPAYHCSGSSKNRHYFRRTKKDVHDRIKEIVEQMSFSDDFKVRFRKILLEEWDQKRIALSQESEAITQNITSLEKQIQSIVKKIAFLNDPETIRDVEQQIKNLRTKKVRAEKEFEKVQKNQLTTQEVVDQTYYYMEHLEELIFKNDTPIENGAMFGLFFESPPNYLQLEDGTLKDVKLSPLFKLNQKDKQGEDLRVNSSGLEPLTSTMST